MGEGAKTGRRNFGVKSGQSIILLNSGFYGVVILPESSLDTINAVCDRYSVVKKKSLAQEVRQKSDISEHRSKG